jgi:hypothetical protein
MGSLVGTTSPLRGLPANLEPRQRVLFDGVRFAIDMAELTFDRLVDALLRISQDGKADNVPGGFGAPFCDAWTVIDSVNRIRPLLLSIPGAKDALPVQHFIQKTEDVYRLRNRVQHLHGRLDKLAADKLPTWGIITWVTVADPASFTGHVHAIVAGSVFDTEHVMENPVGSTIRVPLDLVKLRAHGEVVALTSIPAILQELVSFLEGQLRRQFNDVPVAASDVYLRLEFQGQRDSPTGKTG